MNSNNQKQEHWIKNYTAAFTAVCFMVYSLHLYYGKSFVYSGESLSGMD